MFQILGLNKIKAQDMLNLQLCQFVKCLISKSLWKLKYIIKDILIKLMMPCELGLEPGLGLDHLTPTEMN